MRIFVFKLVHFSVVKEVLFVNFLKLMEMRGHVIQDYFFTIKVYLDNT